MRQRQHAFDASGPLARRGNACDGGRPPRSPAASRSDGRTSPRGSRRRRHPSARPRRDRPPPACGPRVPAARRSSSPVRRDGVSCSCRDSTAGRRATAAIRRPCVMADPESDPPSRINGRDSCAAQEPVSNLYAPMPGNGKSAPASAHPDWRLGRRPERSYGFGASDCCVRPPRAALRPPVPTRNRTAAAASGAPSDAG